MLRSAHRLIRALDGCGRSFTPTIAFGAFTPISARQLLYSTSGSGDQEGDLRVPTAATVGRLNHVAIAVPDLTSASEFYRSTLGAKVSAPQALPEHGVTVVFVELENTKLELLQPLGDNSPVSKYLEKNPAGGLHHVCLEVADVDAGIRHIKSTPVRTLTDKPKIGAHGKPVVFLHPKDCNGVLLELEEAGS
mmetsp:Transcript_31789/g.90291  ORF Transcript_31789/g.90291 Transcript_31789/m.90291 type:complete len:192 (-) Transcript_31789:284-859(-)